MVVDCGGYAQCAAMPDEALHHTRSRGFLDLSMELARKHCGELLD
jgi:hypothetical protein